MTNRTFLLLGCVFSFTFFWGQPNCQAFKMEGDLLKYKACKQAMKIRGHYQFSREYQSYLDESIAIDSTFDYPYWAKSIAYLKSGDFLGWKPLIDQAVKHNPIKHLGYRGWCRYQFFRDYKGAIADIEELDRLMESDIGYSQNGTYHLNVAKALCLKGLGESDKALLVMQKQVQANESIDFIGAFDYLHLGVLYLETGQLGQAQNAFKKQAKINDIAENQYYWGLVEKKQNRHKQAVQRFEQALQLYEQEKRMFDPYSHPTDKIYRPEIKKALESLKP